MLKLFEKLLGRDASARLEVESETEADIDESLSDTQILKEYFSISKQARQALRQFTLLVSQHLGPEESKRLASRVMSFLHPGLDCSDALANGLGDEDEVELQAGKHVRIHFRYCTTIDKLECQANELLRAMGVAASWQANRDEVSSAAQALLTFFTWVRQHGLNVLYLRMNDSAFLVKDQDLSRALELASEAGLEVQDEDGFARDNA